MLAGLLVLSSAVGAMAADYECVGSFIFGRHNDRNVKPANVLSPIGAQHQYDMGSFFRERYYGLNNAGDTVESDYLMSGLNEFGLYNNRQFYGEAISSNVILFSHLSFLQGLYPPTTITTTNERLADMIFAELADGTEIEGPLGGYQYVQSYIQEQETADFIWIKGDVNCPASDLAIDAYFASDEYQRLNSSTLSFFQSLRDILPTEDWADYELNFDNAMNIFDYMNVNYIHNSTLHNRWNQTVLDQVRLLSDQYNFGTCFDESDKLNNMTIGAQTLSGAILNRLNTTLVGETPMINYFTGSFNTFFQFFGISELYTVSDNFTGMPDYGSTMVFELMKRDDDYFVQFSFKNGSTSPIELTTYPLFGTNQTMLPWNDFVEQMQLISISSLDNWCEVCSATIDVCTVYSDIYENALELESNGVNLDEVADGDYSTLDVHSPKLSNAAAGGVGAGVTIGVFLILGALAYLYHRRSSKNLIISSLPVAEKRASNTSSSDNTTI